tara:strand:+ start:6238 stop:6393 length:156 start_codon:yes stop_codon:yes gene_type:complete
MTGPQRDALLALPEDETTVVRHHSLDVNDLAENGGAKVGHGSGGIDRPRAE